MTKIGQWEAEETGDLGMTTGPQLPNIGSPGAQVPKDVGTAVKNNGDGCGQTFKARDSCKWTLWMPT